MRRLSLVLALLALLYSPAVAHAGQYLGAPYTNADSSKELADTWYPLCHGYELERGIYQGKWRFFRLVCPNTGDPKACGGGYSTWTSWTGRTYQLACGYIARHIDTWCWTGTHPRGLGYGDWIRGRDVYHGWERVSSVTCVRWYP